MLLIDCFFVADNLGDSYFKGGNYTLALKCFMEQLEKCEQHNSKNTPDESVTNEYDSDGYYGRRRRAVDSLLEYLESYQLTVKAYHNVANTRFRMGHYEEAANYYEHEMRLLHMVIERSENVIRGSSSSSNSDVKVNGDELLTTSNNSDFVVKLSQSCMFGGVSMILEDLVEKRIDCRRSIGDCHFARKDYEQAIKHYLDFLASSKSLEDQEQVYCMLGKCYQLLNNLAQSLVTYEKRLVLSHELG